MFNNFYKKKDNKTDGNDDSLSGVRVTVDEMQQPPVSDEGGHNMKTAVPGVNVRNVLTEKKLTLLAEYYKSVVATVGGDGYTEWVLNKRIDGGLQIDYYKNGAGYAKEYHETRPAPDDLWDRILAVKKKYNLNKESGKDSIGMCGGVSLVKIVENGEVIRLNYGTLTDDENRAFTEIMDLLTISK